MDINKLRETRDQMRQAIIAEYQVLVRVMTDVYGTAHTEITDQIRRLDGLHIKLEAYDEMLAMEKPSNVVPFPAPAYSNAQPVVHQRISQAELAAQSKREAEEQVQILGAGGNRVVSKAEADAMTLTSDK